MRVRDVDTAQQLAARIGAAIAIRVLHEQMPRLLGDNDALLGKCDAVERIETAGERRASVRLAVAIGVLDHDDFVLLRLAGERVRKARHRDDPETTTRVERNLHRSAQFGNCSSDAKRFTV